MRQSVVQEQDTLSHVRLLIMNHTSNLEMQEG